MAQHNNFNDKALELNYRLIGCENTESPTYKISYRAWLTHLSSLRDTIRSFLAISGRREPSHHQSTEANKPL